MTQSPRTLGLLKEEQALDYLRAQDLQLIARNWTCQGGELDLILLHQHTLVFVEVRYRSRTDWGSALESITPRKQQRLITAAQAFLMSEPHWADYPCRFDVLAIQAQAQGTDHFEWIRHAFDAS